LQPKKGGRSHPKLNILGRPIAKKYSDGRVKRTLKRRLKVLENVKRETNKASNFPMGNISYPPDLVQSLGLISSIEPLVWCRFRGLLVLDWGT